MDADARSAAAVRSGAKDALNLEAGGRHAEALCCAKLLAGRYSTSAMAHNLVGFLNRRMAARAGGGVLSSSCYEEALSAYSVAARLAPSCIVTAVAHGEALADCHHYSKAMSELNRAKQIIMPDDPAAYYAGVEIKKFGYHKNNTREMRLANTTNLLSVAIDELKDKIEIQVIRREVDRLLQLSSNETVRALHRAKLLAKEWPFSGRAHLLLVHIQLQHDFVIRPGFSKADIFRRTMSTMKELEQKFPSSLVIALLHAILLEELDDSTAVFKCREALAIKEPDDPMKHAIPYNYFRGTNSEERIASAKLKIKALHDRIVNEAKLFWGSFAMKDCVTDLRVDELAHFTGTSLQQSPKIIYDACNFFKEHHQWDFIYVGRLNKPCVDANSLRLAYGKVKGFEQLDNVLGDNVYEIRPMDDTTHLDVINYDHLQEDSFKLPDINPLLDSMLSQNDPAVVCELDVIQTKALDAFSVSRDIRNELSALSTDIKSSQYEDSCVKIQNLWTKALHTFYYDYRELIVPLARKFQWAQLKKCMAEANMEPVLKQPALLFILGPFCFKCWEKGHTISDCKLCLLCCCDSHSTPNCPTTRKPIPVSHLVGCAERGQQFYAASQPSSRHAIALVTVEVGGVSVDQLVQEFSDMFDWGWKWAAMEQGQQEFHMKFPNVAAIEMLAKSPLTLEKSGAVIRVSKKVSTVRPKGKLSLVWVVVKGVPDERKDLECLREIGSMIGLVKHIDIQMLEEYDIVKMKVYVKDHNKIPHCKDYVVDGEIYPIYFCLDSVIDPGCSYGNSDNKSGGNAYIKNEWSYLEQPHTEFMDGKLQVQSDLARSSKELTSKECKEPLGSCNLKLEGLRESGVSTELGDMSPNDAGKLVPGEAIDIKTKCQEEEAFGEKKVTLQGKYYEKGESVQTQHQVRPSLLYRSGRLCMPSSVMEKTPLPSKEYIVLGKVVPEDQVNLFAYYCKAAERCQNTYTICHCCSMEGVTDLEVKIPKIEEHIKKYHEHAGES